MSNTRSVPTGSGYVVTDQGRAALLEPSCDCKPQIDGGFIKCRACGTVYALLKQPGIWGKPAWSDKH